jgi:hypothetical protein
MHSNYGARNNGETFKYLRGQHKGGDHQCVKNSPMARAETSAMVMESSMVMRR